MANLQVDDAREMMGINTREELARMEKSLQEEINRKWMAQGVTLKDPMTTYIEEGATIGKDTVIGPNTHLCGTTVIGERCRVDGSAYLTDAHLGDEVHLRFSVVLTSCRVDNGAIIGPFAHLASGYCTWAAMFTSATSSKLKKPTSAMAPRPIILLISVT